MAENFTSPEPRHKQLPQQRGPRPKRHQKPRVLLSCNACRRDKLKCDRGQPCITCVRRNRQGSCVYAVERSARKPSPPGIPSGLQGSPRPIGNDGGSSPTSRGPDGQLRWVPHGGGCPTAHCSPGRAGLPVQDVPQPSPCGAVFISANHWRAISSDATSHLDDGNIQFQDEAPERYRTRYSKPLLLSALCSETSFAERLGRLPSREAADSLVDRFLDSSEPATISVHSPTFREEYVQFWDSPKRASPAWVSLFYAVLACSVWMDHSTNPDAAVSDVPSDFVTYLTQCAAFLALSDFTIPGPYKVDAAALYFAMEYVRVDILKTDLSVLLGLISRQAILAGYHRNPEGHPEISVFDAEMRRRTWLLLAVTDCTIAYETGLPRIITRGVYDAGYPRNLLDEDISPSMTVLPPERSATIECNRITYMIKLEYILSISADIADPIADSSALSDMTDRLNQRLEAIWESVPSVLQFPQTETYMVDGKMSIWRSNLEMTYHRTRCILHRPFLKQRSPDRQTTWRREACVQSAVRILRLEKEVFPILLKRRPNRRRVWFCASRCVSDGLTAAMVLCLELIHRLKDTQSTLLAAEATSNELIDSLRSLEETWSWARAFAPPVERAFKVLTVMLRHMGISESANDDIHEDDSSAFAQQQRDAVGTSSSGDEVSCAEIRSVPNGGVDLAPPQFPIHELMSKDYMEDMFDWNLWDQEMHAIDNLVQ